MSTSSLSTRSGDIFIPRKAGVFLWPKTTNSSVQNVAICVEFIPQWYTVLVFENRVLRRVFGPKRDKVTGEWRKLYNEELSDQYALPNIVRVVK